MKPRLLWVLFGLLLLGACQSPPASTYQAPVYQPPQTPTFSASAASLQLKPLMTEGDVVRALGQPNDTGLETCGGKSGPTFPCKTMSYKDSPYRDGSKELFVVLQADTSTRVWVVTGWRVL